MNVRKLDATSSIFIFWGENRLSTQSATFKNKAVNWAGLVDDDGLLIEVEVLRVVEDLKEAYAATRATSTAA